MSNKALFLLVVLVSAVLATPAEAAEVRQLTQTPSGSVQGWNSSMKLGTFDAAGTTVYINASTNQFGTNPDYAYQIMKFNATGGGSQVTDLANGVSDGPFAVSVSDDGQWLAFLSRSDPLGQNHDESPEVFVMRPNGSELAQLTSDPAPNSGSATMVALAGSANRVIFVSNSNLTGGNAAHRPQLFTVNRDGSVLAQLTEASAGEFSWISISDNGQRVAFSHSGDLVAGSNPQGNVEVFAINSVGSNLRQLTSTAAAVTQVASLAGAGNKIAFDSNANFLGTNADGGSEIFTVDWDTGTITQVTSSAGAGRQALWPSITDNGVTIVFTSNSTALGNSDGGYELWKIDNAGQNLVRLTNYSHSPPPVASSVSGNGQRIAYHSYTNSLHSMAGNGTGVVTLMTTTPERSYWPDITPDGTRVVFTSSGNLTGSDPFGLELYRVQADGSDLFRLTNFPLENSLDPSISADGSVITFISTNNSTGQNTLRTTEVFLINADGTGLQQLTFTAADDPSGYSRVPTISADGSKIAFFSRSDLLGLHDTPYTPSIYCMNSDGSDLTLLTPTATSYGGTAYQQIDATGTWVVFFSNDDLVPGENADHSFEVFRVRCDGSGLEQISASPLYDDYALLPDIDGSGQRIVWYSSADPLGINPERNIEIFLYEPVKGKLRQLTATENRDSYWPRISQDGAWVYFVSDAQFFEEDPDERYDLFRMHLDTNVIERAGALGVGDVDIPENTSFPVAVNGDGDRAVFTGHGDFSAGNRDLYHEVWLVDQRAPQRIIVSGPAPTTISWAPEPRSIRYDVIRGSIAELEPGQSGTVDLGIVVCIENDSPDARTEGLADLVDPLPGQGFFYLFRGSQGVVDGPGSYGTGLNGAERIPASGGCN